MEILLSVDNGDVEIYDRRTLQLLWVLSGQFSSSPASLDLSADLILVVYSCGFGRPRKRSTSFWNVFDRKTKKLLHSVERRSDAEGELRWGDFIINS